MDAYKYIHSIHHIKCIFYIEYNYYQYITIETETNTPKQQNTKKNWARATRSFLRILSQIIWH